MCPQSALCGCLLQQAKLNMWLLILLFRCQNVDYSYLTVSIPREKPGRGVLKLGHWFIKSWVGCSMGQKRRRRRKTWVWESWHPQTSQHHKSSWIHAFCCVCEALCAIKEAEYCIKIFEYEWVVCQRCTANLIPWEDGTDQVLCVSLHRDLNWSRRFDRACQGAAFCSLHGDAVLTSVLYVLHVRTTCKSSCSVLLMQDSSLLSLSFLWWHHSSSETTRWVSRRTSHSLNSTVETVHCRWSHGILKTCLCIQL